jgi:hypothetical protein
MGLHHCWATNCSEPHNNRMQRSGHDKVRGRGRSFTVFVQGCRARVLIGQRAVADAGRWATS